MRCKGLLPPPGKHSPVLLRGGAHAAQLYFSPVLVGPGLEHVSCRSLHVSSRSVHVGLGEGLGGWSLIRFCQMSHCCCCCRRPRKLVPGNSCPAAETVAAGPGAEVGRHGGELRFLMALRNEAGVSMEVLPTVTCRPSRWVSWWATRTSDRTTPPITNAKMGLPCTPASPQRLRFQNRAATSPAP